MLDNLSKIGADNSFAQRQLGRDDRPRMRAREYVVDSATRSPKTHKGLRFRVRVLGGLFVGPGDKNLCKRSPIGARRWKTLGGRGRAHKGDAPRTFGPPARTGALPCGFEPGHPPVHLFGGLYEDIFRIFRRRSPVGARSGKTLGAWGRARRAMPPDVWTVRTDRGYRPAGSTSANRSYTYSVTCTGVYFGYFVNLGALFMHLVGGLHGGIFRIFRESRNARPLVREDGERWVAGVALAATRPRRASAEDIARTNWRALRISRKSRKRSPVGARRRET